MTMDLSIFASLQDELLMGVNGVIANPLVMVMWAIGALLIYLAVWKDYEPTLLLPMGVGAIIANIPGSIAAIAVVHDSGQAEVGWLRLLYDMGIATELFPVLIFIAIGAMCDFGPLMQNPKVMLFAAAAQFGIFATAVAAAALGFSI